MGNKTRSSEAVAGLRQIKHTKAGVITASAVFEEKPISKVTKKYHAHFVNNDEEGMDEYNIINTMKVQFIVLHM